MTYRFRYDPQKNVHLLHTRGVSFDEMADAIESGHLLGFIDNPSSGRGHQKLFIVRYNGYVYTIPAVDEGDGSYFLKTIIPSRKYQKLYH